MSDSNPTAPTALCHILVVDDDEPFRLLLRKELESEGFKISEACSGNDARKQVEGKTFDLILSDIRMPDGNGIELTKYIKKTFNIPVILTTGFSELVETTEASESGADAFLPKPLKMEEAIKTIRFCLSEPRASDILEEGLSAFCKLNIDDFVTGRDIRFDIYIKLGESKFVKIANQGEDLSIDRIHAYKKKDIRYLYMRRQDFQSYIGFNLSLAQVLKSTKRISQGKKLNFIKHTEELILQHLHLDGVDEEGFENARTVTETAVSMLMDDEDAFHLMDSLNSHTDFLYAHSVGVSLYSAMIARSMDWTSPSTFTKVSLAGLFHDIGKKEIDRAILEKPRRELNPDEIKLLESHPQRGMQLLSSVRAAPSDIIQITLQHHENCMGSGYPSGLKRQSINPLAKLVAVANEFCNLTIKNPDCPGIKPSEAILRLYTLQATSLEKAYILALMKLFKVEVPEELADKGKLPAKQAA